MPFVCVIFWIIKKSNILEIQSTLVISNFTGPDKNVRVISSSRQPNCDVIGMTTVRLCPPKRAWKAHVYGNLNIYAYFSLHCYCLF